MLSTEYQEALKRAHYFDVAERYEDMAEEMKKILKMCHENKFDISVSVRNSFSMAYKNLVSVRRSSWRILCAEKQKLEDSQLEEHQIIDESLAKIEKELLALCDDVLQIIENYVIPNLENKPVVLSVFFKKMVGDYYRYKAEVLNGEEEKIASEMALKNYQEGKELADQLNSTDPTRLGLYLNFSVFNYEILNKTEEACNLARTAFDTAISELDSISEDYYKDSTLIMQLLRDNLTLWTTKNGNIQNKTEEGNPEVAQ